MIKLDCTRISVVVRCTDCPPWYGFALDRIEGWQVGARHQERAHGDATQALEALAQQRARDLKRSK